MQIASRRAFDTYYSLLRAGNLRGDFSGKIVNLLLNAFALFIADKGLHGNLAAQFLGNSFHVLLHGNALLDRKSVV